MSPDSLRSQLHEAKTLGQMLRDIIRSAPSITGEVTPAGWHEVVAERFIAAYERERERGAAAEVGQR